MVSVYFGRKNLPKTLFILAAVATCVWLGFWQLDRLEWRRGLNAATRAQLNQPPINLNTLADEETLLFVTDRTITATGQFNFDEQIVLLNQNNQQVGSGVHLVAPFVLEGMDKAILVDRGWISNAEWQSADLRQFDESLSTIEGVVQQYSPRTATLTDGETFLLNFEQMNGEFSADLLPVVLLQTSDNVDPTARPFRTVHEVELSEGSHLGYAVQWFSFAIIFVIGYIFYVRKYG